MRQIWIMICLFCTGCASFQDPAQPLVRVPIPTNSPAFNLEYVPKEGEEKHDNVHSYESISYDHHFYIDGNPCIFPEYVLVVLGEINEEYVVIEIGSHCYSDEVVDGVVFIEKEKLDFYPDVALENTVLAKLYYHFPEGMEAVNYLDYVDYAEGIEIMEESERTE